MSGQATVRLQLRRKDMDGLGHLNQASYHEMFFEARASLLEPIRTDTARYVVARAEIDYLSEVRLSSAYVDVAVRVVEVGRKSFTLEEEMRRADGVLAARSRMVLVGWDTTARRSRHLEAHERSALTAR